MPSSKKMLRPRACPNVHLGSRMDEQPGCSKPAAAARPPLPCDVYSRVLEPTTANRLSSLLLLLLPLLGSPSPVRHLPARPRQPSPTVAHGMCSGRVRVDAWARAGLLGTAANVWVWVELSFYACRRTCFVLVAITPRAHAHVRTAPNYSSKLPATRRPPVLPPTTRTWPPAVVARRVVGYPAAHTPDSPRHAQSTCRTRAARVCICRLHPTMPTPTKLRAGAGDRHAGVQRRRRHTPNASTPSPLKWLVIGAAAVLLLGWIDAAAAGKCESYSYVRGCKDATCGKNQYCYDQTYPYCNTCESCPKGTTQPSSSHAIGLDAGSKTLSMAKACRTPPPPPPPPTPSPSSSSSSGTPCAAPEKWPLTPLGHVSSFRHLP